MASEDSRCVVLLRHGETEWALTGRHTGRRDIPLTDNGRAQARAAAPALAAWNFGTVFCSPLVRARETCDLAGLGQNPVIDADMCEWNYGEYEGLTAAEIQQSRPGWVIWKDGVIGGETVDEVGARADRVIARVAATAGDVCLVAHGHFLRVLTARWLEFGAVEGRRFEMGTAAISVLGGEHGYRAVQTWNDRHHVPV